MSMLKERLKQYLRPDIVLVLMVVAAAFGIYFLGQQIGGTPEQEKSLERQLRSREVNLENLALEVANLESEMTDLEALPIPQPYLSLDEARNLGPALSAYVSDNNLRLLNFNTSSKLVPISEEEQRPVISYLVVVQGDAAALVGLLKLVDAVDTAVVQTLEFSREPELQRDWILTLGMIVYHHDSL